MEQKAASIPEPDLQRKLQQMLDSGEASWSGQKPSAGIPRVTRQDSRLVSDLLIEDRR